MDRRGFLGAMLAACAAPAIVRADSLMRIVPRDALIFHPDAFTLVVPQISGKSLMHKYFQCISMDAGYPVGYIVSNPVGSGFILAHTAKGARPIDTDKWEWVTTFLRN